MMRLGTLAFILAAPGFAPLSFAARTIDWIDRLPYRFEANRGQADASVKYVARGRGYSLGLSAQGSALSLYDASGRVNATVRTRIVGGNPGAELQAYEPQATETNYLIGNDPAKWVRKVPSWGRVRYREAYSGIDLTFYGSSGSLEYDFDLSAGADPSVITLEFAGARSVRIDAAGNLLLATAAGGLRWAKPVIYQQYATGRKLVPGGFVRKGPNRVGFAIGEYDRTRPLVIDPTLAYATYVGGPKNEAAVSVAVDSAGAVYICGYSSSDTLPFTGGSLQPAYAGGSLTAPVHGDAFIAKLDPASGQVIYNTYLGGRGDDFAQAIAVDSTGQAIVAGHTTSSNFPVTQRAYKTTYSGAGGSMFHPSGDAFVAKLNAAGNALVFSTYFGGSMDDAAMALALDASGNICITGFSNSSNLPTTPGVIQPQFRGGGGNLKSVSLSSGTPQVVNTTGDVFVAKFDSAGALVFSTYLGGTMDDIAMAIAVDSARNIYVTGATLSNNFPTTTGAFQTTYRGTRPDDQYLAVTGDAFVTKIDPTGTRLIYSTYLGGVRDEMGLGITVDTAGAAYVTGFTSSTDFPTTAGAYSRTYKGPPKLSAILSFMAGDVFVTKLNAAGSQLAFSTLIGGVNDEGGTGIAVDPTGGIIVTGFTNSGEFPTTSDALQKTFPGTVYVEPPDLTKVFVQPNPIGHPFLLRMAPDGATIPYSTFIGGTGNDRGLTRLALDKFGAAYLAGLTGSTNFPVTANAAQSKYGGADTFAKSDPKGDAWVAKVTGMFAGETQPPVSTITVSSVVNVASNARGAVAPGEIVLITGAGIGPATFLEATVNPQTNILPTSLGGVTVQFGKAPAALLSVSATKVTAIVPYELDGQSAADMIVSFNGQSSAPLTLTVAPSAPGLFSADGSGSGQALANNSDGTPNSIDYPVFWGEPITLYGTGEGQTDPAGVNGQITGDEIRRPLLPVSVAIAGVDAEVVSYGGVPGKPAGNFQVTVKVPDGIGDQDQSVVLKVGSARSQQNLTIAVTETLPVGSAATRKPQPTIRRRRPVPKASPEPLD